MHLTCSVYKGIQRMKESNYHGAERVKQAHLFFHPLKCICLTDHNSNQAAPPQEHLHVWTAVFGDATCALKLYLDLLWTVWYRKRERGLNLSLFREWLPKRIHNKSGPSLMTHWATMNTHKRYEHIKHEGMDKWYHYFQNEGLFLLTKSESTVIVVGYFWSSLASSVAASVLPVCLLLWIQYFSQTNTDVE